MGIVREEREECKAWKKAGYLVYRVDITQQYLLSLLRRQLTNYSHVGVKKNVRAFATWKSILIQDVADMRRIEGTISFFSLYNISKRVREIGWHCYQAEEHLSVLELCRLKNELEINDLRWRWYKAQFVDKGSTNSFSKFRAIFKVR